MWTWFSAITGRVRKDVDVVLCHHREGEKEYVVVLYHHREGGKGRAVVLYHHQEGEKGHWCSAITKRVRKDVVIGFYVRFEDDSVESAKIVKQWNVKIISISKNKRHQDRAAALEVWDRLEEFMRSRSHS
ncbi:hypothetical protein M5K25_017803 [Dendrobium thyrsiflorum]|uniref:Cell division control protein 73 C-terminal domain-containing protein n=1 Tax=Dendrobium thyrsiflorum TaxID=117978 RepID=A0ABD0UGT5_DENTH